MLRSYFPFSLLFSCMIKKKAISYCELGPVLIIYGYESTWKCCIVLIGWHLIEILNMFQKYTRWRKKERKYIRIQCRYYVLFVKYSYYIHDLRVFFCQQNVVWCKPHYTSHSFSNTPWKCGLVRNTLSLLKRAFF